jgi:hypothetical protein
MISHEASLVKEIREEGKVIQIFRMPLGVAGVYLASLRDDPIFGDSEASAAFEEALRIAIVAGSRLEIQTSIVVAIATKEVSDESGEPSTTFEFTVSPLSEHIADLILPYQFRTVGACSRTPVDGAAWSVFDSLPTPSEQEKKVRGN